MCVASSSFISSQTSTISVTRSRRRAYDVKILHFPWKNGPIRTDKIYLRNSKYKWEITYFVEWKNLEDLEENLHDRFAILDFEKFWHTVSANSIDEFLNSREAQCIVGVVVKSVLLLTFSPVKYGPTSNCESYLDPASSVDNPRFFESSRREECTLWL